MPERVSLHPPRLHPPRSVNIRVNVPRLEPHEETRSPALLLNSRAELDMHSSCARVVRTSTNSWTSRERSRLRPNRHQRAGVVARSVVDPHTAPSSCPPLALNTFLEIPRGAEPPSRDTQLHIHPGASGGVEAPTACLCTYLCCCSSSPHSSLSTTRLTSPSLRTPCRRSNPVRRSSSCAPAFLPEERYALYLDQHIPTSIPSDGNRLARVSRWPEGGCRRGARSTIGVRTSIHESAADCLKQLYTPAI